MPHASLQDLVDAVGSPTVLKLLDDDNDGVADPGALASVLADADSELRVIVGRAYTAEEFAKAGADVTKLATEIAVHLAYKRRPEFLNDKQETPWQRSYEAAIATAKLVASAIDRIDRDGSGRAGPQNVPRYVALRTRYFLDGTGDF